MSDNKLPLFQYSEREHAATWSPRDLWLQLDEYNIAVFAEDRRLERKRSGRINFDDLSEYYSMWSNTVDGGILLFGVEDNGKISGCYNLSQEQINKIEKFHCQYCPEARPEFRRISCQLQTKKDFVIAIFLPYRGLLVENNKGDAFIRFGDQKHKMSAEEKEDFRGTRQERSWELRVASTYRFPNDFDQSIISEFCSNFRSRESKEDWSDTDVLIDRLLLCKDGGSFSPRNCLVLFAAKNPRLLNHGARIRIQRFHGDEEGAGPTFSPLKDFYIEGNIPTIIKDAGERISDLIYNVTWLNNDGKFVTTPEYPRWAWLEAIVNALVHRSYSFSGTEVTVKFFSNRLDVESPGGFVPPVNAENVYSQRASRNPVVMEALRYLGFVQMTREGTRRMKESMLDYNLPVPSFSQEAVYGVSVKVTLQNDHHTRKRATDKNLATYCGAELWRSLREHEVNILMHAFNNGKIHVNEAVRITGRQWSTCKRDLEKLASKGLLKFVSSYHRDPHAHYAMITEDDRPEKEE